jgi:hypothetical protein
MLAPLSESAPAQDPSADKSDIAQTVPQSVMAEQVSHNVVNVSESASGSSPLVDVVANHTSTAASEGGNNTDATSAYKPQDSYANNSNTPDGREVEGGHAATEPSAGDAVAKPDNVPAISPPSDADHGSHMTNGVHDSASQGSVIEDGGSQDVSAVNSDTEGKGEALEMKDGHLHVRTNSVKKPATFSKISVTKNFLAKSASTAPVAAKTGEKGMASCSICTSTTNTTAAAPVNPVAPPATKPRLIAKSGATLQLQKARQNAESPSGPDASKVWNKNRPTAPPPPKQFTDEELKQQYGIHLATRLQSDENGKESKWADIDEDEDDWVPDAVTWIDGTKSALTSADNVPAPKETKPAEVAQAKPAEGAKPSLAVLKKEPSGPPKTILKPGAAIQAKQNGISTQSPGPEKATLKAKSPAPPSKSPWAPLPPVDRASPVNPPVQQVTAPLPFASQDARSYESSMPPPPPREMAADTFDRSWREGEGGSRELFNSVSGRYEPAPEGRRSSRPDPYGRKPSVLLRSSQHGTDHPEPSPAFQTRSGSQTDGPPSWAARRRGSSVSQSGMAPRRMSVNRAPEQAASQDRRPSVAVDHASPVVPKAEMPQNNFPQQDAWSQQMPPPPPAGAGEELEDPVKVQERIMKEKRESARKRRQEEEQQAEVARKERLKAKMAALEGAGQSRQERQAAKEAAASAPKPAAEQAAVSTKPTETGEVKSAQPKSPDVAVMAASGSEPQAPKPVAAASVPLPNKPEQPLSISKPEGAGMPTRSISEHMQRQAPRGPLSPKANTRAPFQSNTASPYRAPNSAFSSPGERKQQPFGRLPMASSNDSYSPWPSAGNGNVWGTGTMGIGNGVFDSTFSPLLMTQQQGLPPPPGMTRSATSNRISPQGLGPESSSPGLQSTQMAEQSRAFAPPGMEGRPDHFMSHPRTNGPSPGPGMGRQQRVPGPIAPPSRAQPPVQNQAPDDKLSAWKSAAQTMPAQYASASKTVPGLMDDAPPVQRDDVFKETFKQTTRGRLGGPRKFEKTEYTVHDAQGSRTVASLVPAPPSTQTQPAVPVPTASPLNHPWKQSAENTVRLPNGSMNPAHGGTPVQQQLPIGHPQSRPQPAPVGTPRRVQPFADPLPPTVDSKEPSPPPPETATHPVYSGNAKHPHVRLPRSKPVVKLPPQDVIAPSQQQSVMMPPRQHWGPPGAMRPLVQNEAWQARFNGLFNRTSITTETPPSPPKTPPKTQGPALVVASSTRTDVLDNATNTGATVSVSLPQAQRVARNLTAHGFLIDDSKDVTSKDTIEQMFNEELSFGSKPLTRIPRNVSYPENGIVARYNMLALSAESNPSPTETQSKAEFDMAQVHYRNAKGCFVKMPGVKTKHNPIFWKRNGQNKAFNKPKAKAPIPKDSGANSPASAAPSSGPAAGSRKASGQKVLTGPNTSTPQQKSPAPVAQDSAVPRRGPPKAPRGRGQNAPVKTA